MHTSDQHQYNDGPCEQQTQHQIPTWSSDTVIQVLRFGQHFFAIREQTQYSSQSGQQETHTRQNHVRTNHLNVTHSILLFLCYVVFLFFLSKLLTAYVQSTALVFFIVHNKRCKSAKTHLFCCSKLRVGLLT